MNKIYKKSEKRREIDTCLFTIHINECMIHVISICIGNLLSEYVMRECECMKEKNWKVGFVASSGGHLEEIIRLKKIEALYDSFLVTEKGDFKMPDFGKRQYMLPQMNRREIFFIPKFLWLFVHAVGLLKKEKPDFLITTGALVAYPMCVVAKIMGIKVIYIESYARVHKPSLTGRLLYNFSDLFVVQWDDMLAEYPKAVLGGGIF